MKNDYLKEDERELLALVDWFCKRCEAVEKEKGRLAANEQQLKITYTKMAESVQRRAARRQEDEQKRIAAHNQQAANHLMECTKCNSTAHVKWTGTTAESKKNKGWTHFKYHCTACNLMFLHYMPVEDEHLLQWYENFLSQMEKTREDGSTYVEILNITSARLQELKNSYAALKASIEKVEAATKIIEEEDAKLDEIIERQRNALLVMKTKTSTWGSGMGAS